MALDSNLSDIVQKYITPALAFLPARMNSPEALVMLLAIGQQESGFRLTHQVGGPAVGYWQFEKGGGVTGVLTHPASRDLAHQLCDERDVAATSTDVYGALERDQILAAGFARLLLWTDPKPLPALGEVNDAWATYLRNWRPGKPHPNVWPGFYSKALEHVRS